MVSEAGVCMMRANGIRIECHVRQPAELPPVPSLTGPDEVLPSVEDNRIPRIAVIGPPGLAIEVSRLRPNAIIDVHVADWGRVDEAREAVASAGVADRVHVHHWLASMQIDAGAYDVVLRAPEEVQARPPGLDS